MEVYQKMAREFGYAETSFVRISREHKALQVRSFTAGGFEVGGAGHNLLGAVCFALIRGWDIFSGQADPWVIMKDTRIPLRVKKDAQGRFFVEGTSVAEARFFNPGLGIVEDPGTGSAAGPLAGLLHSLGYIKTGKEYTFLQGVTMQQPCTITVQVEEEGIWVSGSSVIVMEGKIHI